MVWSPLIEVSALRGICFPAYYSFLPCGPLASFRREFDDVSTLMWHDGMDMGEMLGSPDAEPVVLRGTPVDRLWAARNWTMDTIVERVPILKEVRVQKGDNVFRYHNRVKSPIGAFQAPKPKFSLKSITPVSFFESMQDVKQKMAEDPTVVQDQNRLKNLRFSYYSMEMRDPNHALQDLLPDVSPVEILQVAPGRKPANKYHQVFKQHLWLGGEGVTTQLHFDLSHNAFVQLVGRKRFYLLPPAAAQAVYMHPLLHDRNRDSRVPWQPDVEDPKPIDGFPSFNAIRKVLVADLLPGDVLLVPAMWLHHVVSMASPSISVNVWSESVELSALPSLEVQLYHSQDSWKEMTGSNNYLASSQIFLRRLIERTVDGTEFAVDFAGRPLPVEEGVFRFVMNLLEQRYTSLEVQEQIQDPAQHVPCQPAQKGAKYRKVKQMANEMAAKLQQMRPSDGVLTLLTKFVEIIVGIAGGPRMGPAFLAQCVCGTLCQEALAGGV